MKMTKQSRRLALISLLILLILSFSWQGMRSIWQPDEGYYSGIAMSMIEHDTLVVPYLGEHEIFLDKPPLIYWGIIGGMKLFGTSEFGVRVFHGLSFFITCIFTGLLAADMFKKRVIGIFAALIYATMTVPFSVSNFVTPDTLLVLWTTAAMYCFWKSLAFDGKSGLWKVLLCGALGFGFLAKGPAVLIPCGGMFVFLALSRQLKRFFITPWAIVGFLVFIAIGLSWYIWISIELEGAMKYLFDSQVWGRLVSKKFNRNPGFTGMFIYVPVLIFGTFPWSTVFIEKFNVLKSSLGSKAALKGLCNNHVKLLLVCWFVVQLIVLCAASSRLGLYALPVFPAIAIACAKVWYGKLAGELPEGMAAFVKMYRKSVVWFAVWCVLILGSRVAMAYIPSEDDMEKLAAEIMQIVPDEKVEICAIDRRADGLIFYMEHGVEFISSGKNNYPTYYIAERIMEELITAEEEKEALVFLIDNKKNLERCCGILNDNEVKYSTVELDYNRTIIFPEQKFIQE